MNKIYQNHFAILTCHSRHDVIADFSGTDNAPYKYRILFPIIIEFLQIFLKFIFNEKISFQISYIFLNAFSIFFFTILCFFYFKKYFKNSTSIIGVLLIGILINVHLKDLFVVNTILDASFLVLALLLINKSKSYINN